jgi:hypothetical protein
MKKGIEEEIDQEMQKIVNLKRMLKGTVNKVVIKNNGKSTKERIIYQLTYKGEKNVTKTIYVKKEKLTEVKKMTENYRKAKESFERIIKLNEKLFKMN